MFGLFDDDELRDRPEVVQGKRMWRDGNVMRVESDEEYHARLAGKPTAEEPRLKEEAEKALTIMRKWIALNEGVQFDVALDRLGSPFFLFRSLFQREELVERHDSLADVFRHSQYLMGLINRGVFEKDFDGISTSAIAMARACI